jgi:hypothetical protein
MNWNLEPVHEESALKAAPSAWMTLCLAGAIVLSACDAVQVFPVIPTTYPGVFSTFAAETLVVDSTNHPDPPTPAFSSPTPSQTLTSSAPSGELTPATRTPLPSLTPTLSPTPTVPMRLDDGSLAPCNAAEYIQDVSIPDGTLLRPGQKFTKVWEFRNVGNCTWTKSYAVVLVYGNPMGVASPVPLRQEVHPGEKVEISLNMMAPYIPACWVGWWKFQDDKGNRFGIGFGFQEIFWIKIGIYIPRIGSTKKVCTPLY